MSLNITKKRQGGNVQETKVITFADQTLIRGKDNTQTVPVKVDEQGRLVLAADLNIDVGDISIGAVEQGKRSESAEPWEVVLTGRYEALSTDVKPTLGSSDRATFFEWDTQKLYYWDGSAWVEVQP